MDLPERFAQLIESEADNDPALADQVRRSYERIWRLKERLRKTSASPEVKASK